MRLNVVRIIELILQRKFFSVLKFSISWKSSTKPQKLSYIWKQFLMFEIFIHFYVRECNGQTRSEIFFVGN